MSNLLNEKFSTRAKSALLSAQKISRQFGHPKIGTEHLLHGIIAEISSFASEVLLKNRVSEEMVRLELVRIQPVHPGEAALWRPRLSENLRQVLQTAAAVAAQYQYQFIGTEHFLYGIVKQPANTAQEIMKRLKIEPGEIKKNLLSIFENVSKFPEGAAFGFRENQKEADEHTTTSPALDYFTVDLTQRAKEGKIDPLVGREKEVQRLISILNRRTKNNPVLIGDPGVGKTAIVEGLALSIRNRDVPDTILGKKILALDLALIVAGSMFRGEFENRLKQIIEEIRAAGDIILFIDELHTVIGAGATTGSLDAANILKPALARGELRAIGATTLSEYKKYIEQDPALERRFQPILIKEPTAEETLRILKGLRSYYESHHGVKILDEALEAAIKLSERYIADRFLPDKAIDLVDETAAYYKIIPGRSQAKTSLKKIERELADLEDQKKKAVFSGDFQAALSLKTKESEMLGSKQKILKKEKVGKKPLLTIKASHIAETISRILGIPLTAIMRKEAQKLLALEKNLKNQLVGQDEVLRVVAASIRRSRTGIAAHDRPLGSFMFLGPTGVGKTFMAKLLAKEIFEDESSLIRIDMSELMERHNVARLIGAPAGYVGYEEGGRLTEAIRRRPYAVVLFDEIEKAHPDVFNILLQILEEGELTDAAGKKVNFRNTIIIMTSNIGLSSLNHWAKSFGFDDQANKSQRTDAEAIKQQVIKKVQEHFRPEFLNRIDKIVVFEPLNKGGIKKILILELKKLVAKLSEQKLKLAIPSLVINHLAERSFDPGQGARLVRKNLQDLVEDRIAEAILGGKVEHRGTIRLKLSKSGTNVEIVS